MSYLTFHLTGTSDSGITSRWTVTSGQATLGEVRWWAHWRKYTYWPVANIILDEECLKEIATFIQQKTTRHKA